MTAPSFTPGYFLAWTTVRPVSRRQSGSALIVSLLMLISVSLLGISAAQIALEGGRAAYNEHDRQLAFHAAEAALLDAELHIQGMSESMQSLSDRLAVANNKPVPQPCVPKEAAYTLTVRQLVNCLGTSDSAKTVPYGLFTGQSFPVGEGPLPRKLPRYIVEPLPDRRPGQNATEKGSRIIYRVTAIGFGMRETTQVILQTIYRKTL